ncbi:MAG TPA: TerB family tellurite resistance protein [Candidatus Nitrosotenuis sp.]|jgi:uncharacterized tellurite resistance protein B-like protein|nr:TerB family tellurite resistance protein [Candidatus Nitrosotenuis sp.]
MSRPQPSDYSEQERSDYLTMVASLAAADGQVDSAEVYALRELSLLFGLSPQARQQVLAICESPPQDLSAVLERLAGSELRYSLLVDLATFAYSDGVLQPGEESEIRRFAEAMKVDAGHVEAVLRFAKVFHTALSTKDVQSDEFLQIARAARADLEKAGVPLRAVAVSGTMLGLARQGIDLEPEVLGSR